MAAGQDKVWVDAFADKTFTACPSGAISSDSESWGWISDPKAPGGGTSCHRNITIHPEAVAVVCSQESAADYHSGDCKSGNAKSSAAKPGGSALPADDEGEDSED